MLPDNASAPKGRGWVRLLIAFVVAFDVAAFFQWADGAFESEFGGHPDEAQNFLAALRTRDALIHARDRASAGNENSPPTAQGRAPAFSRGLGAWMAVFGKSRISALLFMATLAAATTTLIFSTVRRELGMWAATVATLLWLCAPAVRESYATILPEQFGALVLTGAALLWARLMDEGSLRRTAAPKWIGAAAMLGIAGVLAFALAVTLKLVPGDPRVALHFLKECVSVPGIAVAAFALAGMVIRPRSETRTGTVWIAITALVAGVLFARWLKSEMPDVRVLIVATPALAMLATRGAISLARSIVGQKKADTNGGQPRREALWIFLLLLLALPRDLSTRWQKDWHGFAPIARTLLDEARAGTRVLVVSDVRGEGMLLSEIAMHDREGKISVERGSETLVESGSVGPQGKPQQRFLEDEQLFAHLTSGRIRYIVLDSAVPQDVRAGYHDQVQRVLESNVRSFWPIYDSPIIRDGEPQGHPLRIFRVVPSDEPQLR
jgi:hypothetical protein